VCVCVCVRVCVAEARRQQRGWKVQEVPEVCVLLPLRGHRAHLPPATMPRKGSGVSPGRVSLANGMLFLKAS
jgi:hypothetical protein